MAAAKAAPVRLMHPSPTKCQAGSVGAIVVVREPVGSHPRRLISRHLQGLAGLENKGVKDVFLGIGRAFQSNGG
jgi:hypothetical protein